MFSSSKYFLIFPVIFFSLSHGLFTDALFQYSNIWWDFLDNILQLISNQFHLISLLSENTYDFNPFKFEIYFMAEQIAIIVNVSCALEQNEYSVVLGV